LFPQACCDDVFGGEKFCCTGGFRKRKLEPAYARQVIQ
jgi:hypothetical protein